MSKLTWWERLNKALFPYLGPAQLGPFDEAPLPSVEGKPCPICGRAMSLHSFERSQGHTATRMYCPPLSRADAA